MTWHELGASAAVVECAAVGAVSLAVRRRALDGARTHAMRALAAALPDALDLLAACVEGGATLDGALAAVAPHVEGGLGARLAACAAQLRSTRPRREVLRALGGEPVRELERAGHALASADELGSPLAATLTRAGGAAARARAPRRARARGGRRAEDRARRRRDARALGARARARLAGARAAGPQ